MGRNIDTIPKTLKHVFIHEPWTCRCLAKLNLKLKISLIYTLNLGFLVEIKPCNCLVQRRSNNPDQDYMLLSLTLWPTSQSISFTVPPPFMVSLVGAQEGDERRLGLNTTLQRYGGA
jgi:hypothetical protein